MCGIAGVVAFNDVMDPAITVPRMCARIIHRGPDDDGYYSHANVTLGQRRLSIIDLERGHQPLSNEDGTVWVTFNGEIYNFGELRADLCRRGHVFRTQTDTEVIVHGYEEYGRDVVKKLRGMFAFAIYDTRTRLVFLARDHVGKKPLFYTQHNGALLFASELQALVPELDGVQPDYHALDLFLSYGYIPAPWTGFRGVSKLLPGHTLVFSTEHAAEPQPEPFWALEYAPKLQLSAGEAEERLHAELREAVRLRMIADVPVGALLSGGVDSSLIVALMAEQSSSVRTFCVGFEDRQYDELPYAREVAGILGTKHTELRIQPDAMAILPTLVRHYGEPFADSSAVPSYYVAQMTRQHVKVALNGDGGDESFAGYDRYMGSMLADRFSGVVPWRVLNGSVMSLIPDTLHPRHRLGQVKRFAREAARPGHERYTRWMTYFRAEHKATLYSPAFKDILGEYEGGEWLQAVMNNRQQQNLLDTLLATDVASYLPYDLLVKMDIASMANSLEARSPFLDVSVMEFAARLAPDFKLRGRTMKYLSKRLAKRYFPARLVDRRKMGFGIPLGSWLRGDLRAASHELLIAIADRGLFNRAAVNRLLDEQMRGHDHAQRIWSLMWLELWHREFLDTSHVPHHLPLRDIA